MTLSPMHASQLWHSIQSGIAPPHTHPVAGEGRAEANRQMAGQQHTSPGEKTTGASNVVSWLRQPQLPKPP